MRHWSVGPLCAPQPITSSRNRLGAPYPVVPVSRHFVVRILCFFLCCCWRRCKSSSVVTGPQPQCRRSVCVCVCQRHTGRRRAGSNLCLPSSSASILAPRAQNTVHLLAAPEQRQQSRAQTALSYSLLATKAGPDANELDKLLDTNIMRDLALSPPLDARQQPNRLSE